MYRQGDTSKLPSEMTVHTRGLMRRGTRILMSRKSSSWSVSKDLLELDMEYEDVQLWVGPCPLLPLQTNSFNWIQPLKWDEDDFKLFPNTKPRLRRLCFHAWQHFTLRVGPVWQRHSKYESSWTKTCWAQHKSTDMLHLTVEADWLRLKTLEHRSLECQNVVYGFLSPNISTHHERCIIITILFWESFSFSDNCQSNYSAQLRLHWRAFSDHYVGLRVSSA